MPDSTDPLRVRLGLPDAPLVRAGLAMTAAFFRDVLREDPLAWFAYLRGIDFHKPVTRVTLAPGTRLVRWDQRGKTPRPKPFVYFTDPGASPFRTGTSFPDVEYHEFVVAKATVALHSFASPISFDPSDRVSRMGGAPQYIVATRDAPPLTRTGGR